MSSIQSYKKPARFVATGLVFGVTAICAAIGFFPENAVAVKVQQFDSVPQNKQGNLIYNVVQETPQPKIQIAILLDTSSSMQGLIDQTKNQLWSIVNEFSAATRQGQTPLLEVALYEYGNSGISGMNHHIRQLNSFTSELDLVSEGLFSLRTNGGNEYCGAVIQAAVQDLQWSTSDKDIKAVFIAGNEGFSQGPVAYQEALELAMEKGIAVSTIYAGNSSHRDSTGWKSGAQLAGGEFMSIDANQQIVHIDAPQDQRIALLNSKLNETYVPYGKLGAANAQRQQEQDAKNRSISSGLLAKRVKTKSSSYYSNESWDLVDALEQGEVKDAELSTLDKEQLPAVMREMNSEQRKNYVAKQSQERSNIKQEIAELSKQREEHVAAQRKQNIEEGASLGDALLGAVKSQATAKGFQLNDNEGG